MSVHLDEEEGGGLGEGWRGRNTICFTISVGAGVIKDLYGACG